MFAIILKVKKFLHLSHPFRIFWFSALITILLGLFVIGQLGLAAIWIFCILVILEVTFSFDNAVINSKVLVTMSPFWQKIFLTVGIFIAVFVVRFLLPIVIVMIASTSGFSEVVDLALNNPDDYSQLLHEAAPMIEAFGGTFLLMIGLSYFIDRNKKIHWLSSIEKSLSRVARLEDIKVSIMLTIVALLYFTVDQSIQGVVLVAGVLGVLLHILLHIFGSLFSNETSNSIKQKTGWAAFASFLYLEVLDASFSFDGVVGAFAITSNIILIIAGLGAGAIWVRSMTVYLMKSNTLTKFSYLEHGAHWAIMALGLMMLIKLWGLELPEWITGGIGVVFIGTAVLSSIAEKKISKQ